MVRTLYLLNDKIMIMKQCCIASNIDEYCMLTSKYVIQEYHVNILTYLLFKDCVLLSIKLIYVLFDGV